MTRTREDGKEEVFSACIKPETDKKADYNWIRGSNGQDTDKVIRALRLGGCASESSSTGSGGFYSSCVRSDSGAYIGFFTTVKLD